MLRESARATASRPDGCAASLGARLASVRCVTVSRRFWLSSGCARLWRVALVLGLLTGAVACSGGPAAPTPVETSSTPAPPTPAPSTPSAPSLPPASSEAASVIQLTNAERAAAGVPALAANSRLVLAAQLHADQMAQLQRMEHTLAEGPYPSPADRLSAAGYAWRTYGENIAFNYRSPEEVMRGWMGSSGHRANILNGSFTEMGVAVARDGQGRPYWAQVFAAPRS